MDFGLSPVLTLHDVAQLLRRLPEDTSEVAHRAAFELAAALGRPTSVRLLLASIDRDLAELTAVAKRSFRHTNHFDKIMLVDDDTVSRYRLALHLWRPPYSTHELEDEQIHDHRNDFWSTVLFGALQSREFVRSANGPLFVEVTYRPARSSTGSKVNEYSVVGPTRLHCMNTVRWRAGSTYHLQHDQIHRIAISNRPTATLLLKGPHVSDITSLFRSKGHYETVELAPFDLSTLRDRLSFISKSLPS